MTSRLETPESDIECPRQRDYYSPFMVFLSASTNIPKVWETILLAMDVCDVATCLRTCKKLRAVVKQCLESNSKFRSRLDKAVVSKMWMKKATLISERVKVRLKFKVETSNTLSSHPLAALNNVLFVRPDQDRYDFNLGHQEILAIRFDWNTLELEHENVIGVIFPSSMMGIFDLKAHPTTDDARVLIEVSHGFVEVELNNQGIKVLNCTEAKGQYSHSRLRDSAFTPYRIRTGREPFQRFADVHSSSGRLDLSFPIADSRDFLSYGKLFNPSREKDELVVITKDRLTIYGLHQQIGEIIWQEALDARDNLCPTDAFVSDDIVGMLAKSHAFGHGTILYVWDRASGKKHLFEMDFTDGGRSDRPCGVLCRGRFVVLSYKKSIKIIRVWNRDTSVAVLHEDLLKGLYGKSEIRQFLAYAVEFLGRNHIIIAGHCTGNRRRHISMLFQVDLDAATSQADISNAVTLLTVDEEGDSGGGFYKPIFEGDRAERSLKMVGVAKVQAVMPALKVQVVKFASRLEVTDLYKLVQV